MQFSDSFGRVWDIEITADGVENVRSLVKSADGTAVDLFEATEKGNFEVLKNIKTITEVVFVLCLPQIMSEFDAEAYDRENANVYELLPARKTAQKTQKASWWFSSGLTGSVLEEMTEALLQALVNFTSNPGRREAIRKVLEKEKELEKIAFEQSVEKMTSKMDKILKEKMDALEQSPPWDTPGG